MQHPAQLNQKLFEAQQARRVLDRLVGYQVSPLLWDKVKRGISAGRVQSVALRIIVEREQQREAFRPEEYWTLDANVAAKNPPQFRARLYSYKDQRIDNKSTKLSKPLADEIVARLRESTLYRPQNRAQGGPPQSGSAIHHLAFAAGGVA